MNVQRVAVKPVYVFRQLGKQAVEVGRTAGAGKALDALRDGIALCAEAVGKVVSQRDLQRIFVEKRLAVKRKAGQHAIVQHAFNGIGIGRFGFECQHPPTEEHQPNAGAGFGVGLLVGKVVGSCKDLADTSRTNAAGDVHFAFGDVPVQGFARLF